MPGGTLGQKVAMVVAAIVGVVALLGLIYEGSEPNAPATAPAIVSESLPSPPAKKITPGVDLGCLAQRIGNAPAPFHLSYTRTVPVLLTGKWEANVTSATIAGTFADASGVHAIHAVRTDLQAWRAAVNTLSSPLPVDLFQMLDNSAALTPGGTENVNGVSADKYAIDTARDTPSDAEALANVMGPGGFLRGAAWVTADGCPVKFVLDGELHPGRGKVDKEHYEADVTTR